MTQFERHFTVSEAEALLPRLRAWFADLKSLDKHLLRLGREQRQLLESKVDAGLSGPELNDFLVYSLRWRAIVHLILESGVQIKDLERGLCDFPHLLPDGREVFLCWEARESHVEHWHELDEGFGQRQPL